MSDYDANLEKLYLPSRWSQRYPPDVIVDKHIEFATKENERAKESVPHQLDIKYGDLEKEKFDIFGTDLPPESPILIFIHGGYWQEQSLTRSTYHFLAPIFYKNGIKTVFLGYELCPKVTLFDIIKEIETATSKFLQNKKIFLAGYSAGAHLAAAMYTNLATLSGRHFVKAVFLIAGIYDLSEIPKTSVNEPLKLDERQAEKLSPLFGGLIGGENTRFFVISAKNDSPEFQKQAGKFHEKLQNGGWKSIWRNVGNVDHFDLVENLVFEDFEVTKLILKEIKNSN